MSVAFDLKKQLKLNIQSSTNVQTVYGYEEINPSGYPAVMLTAADMEGEFSSNAENRRMYAFKCTILFPISGDFVEATEMPREEYAEKVILQVVDDLVNTMDTDFELTGTQALYMEAADCIWYYTKVENGEARAADITLRIYTELTVV